MIVLLNQNAGSYEEAHRMLELSGKYPRLRVRHCANEKEAEEAVQTGWATGCREFVAGGGDGTVHWIVNALRERLSEVRIGILPLGTGNDLSRTLGLPSDLSQAIDVLLSGQTRRLDLILVENVETREDRLCVNSVSGGFAGDVEQVLTPEMKARWGDYAYLRAAVNVAAKLPEYEVELRLDDGSPLRMAIVNVAVANGRTVAGGFEIAPAADPADGWMDIAVIERRPLRQLLHVAVRFLAGDYRATPGVHYYRTKTFQVTSTDLPIPLSVDGKQMSSRQVRFTVLSGALSVIVPRREATGLRRETEARPDGASDSVRPMPLLRSLT